jgi:hypothetical protein
MRFAVQGLIYWYSACHRDQGDWLANTLIPDYCSARLMSLVSVPQELVLVLVLRSGPQDLSALSGSRKVVAVLSCACRLLA